MNSSHPYFLKYQGELKQRLSELLEETDGQLLDLKRAVDSQEKENSGYATRGYELQKELKLLEDKLESLNKKQECQISEKANIQKKCQQIENSFQNIDKNWKSEIQKDLELQRKLENVSLQIVQLTLLQNETSADAKNLKFAAEKSAKDKEDLVVQKLRQDLLMTRLENDKSKLEDKINLFRTQCAIKMEEAKDLRNELILAKSEMETINNEKTHIVHQWRQSLIALEKQSRVVSQIRDSVRQVEDQKQTYNVEIAGLKKKLRKELELNEQLGFNMLHRDADVACTEKSLRNSAEQEKDLERNVDILEKTIDITENELKYFHDKNIEQKKEIEVKDREMAKVCAEFKDLEQKHINILHGKLAATKATKLNKKAIEDIRNVIHLNEEKMSNKESEKSKLLMKIENLKCLLSKKENDLQILEKERQERLVLFNRSEADVLENKNKADSKRGEIRELTKELEEKVNLAGGQELAPFERELANLKKEIRTSEQGKRNMEREYLNIQHELFNINKQYAIKVDENDFNYKKIAILEGKKMQINADIVKEEVELKDIKNRLEKLKNEVIIISNLLCERKVIQESLHQDSSLVKHDLIQDLKEAELKYCFKQNELKSLERKKKRKLKKLLEVQREFVQWEGKIHLAEETQKILKSESLLEEFNAYKSEIRKLTLDEQKLLKKQNILMQEMRRAVERHAKLYVEADKQALFGKRKKSPEYVQTTIRHIQKKIQNNKKKLKSILEDIESLRATEYQLEDKCRIQKTFEAELKDTLSKLEHDIDEKSKRRRQNGILLSYKQKKSKFIQNVTSKSYIRAIRQDDQRLEELQKLKDCLEAIKVICQATKNDHPPLEKFLTRIMDYIEVSKQL